MFVTAARAVSWLMATLVNPHEATDELGQSVTVCGLLVCVRSTREILLLPLFATRASCARGRTATPSGFVPTEIGSPIVPTAPTGVPLIPVGVLGVSATSETV